MTYDFAARAPPCSAWGDEPDGDAESQALPRPTKSKPTGNRSPGHLQTLSHPGAGGLRIQFLAYAVRGSEHMPNLLSFQYQGVCVHPGASAVSDSLRPCGLQPSRLLCPWDPPGKNTGVGCHALLQGTFPIQGMNPGLLHCRWNLYCQVTREASISGETIQKWCRANHSFLLSPIAFHGRKPTEDPASRLILLPPFSLSSRFQGRAYM